MKLLFHDIIFSSCTCLSSFSSFSCHLTPKFDFPPDFLIAYYLYSKTVINNSNLNQSIHHIDYDFSNEIQNCEF